MIAQSDRLGRHGHLTHGGRLYVNNWVEIPEPAGVNEAM
jgi:hypothetical protein